jgi:hypothetical protein
VKSSKRQFATMKSNYYKRKIDGFEINFARGRYTKRCKRNFPSKEKGVF